MMNQEEQLQLYNGKRVLVTGGFGMIGSNIAIKLSDLGAFVTILDSMVYGMGGNYFNIEPVKNKVRIAKHPISHSLLDIRSPHEDLLPFLDRVDIIINCAGQVDHQWSVTHEKEDWDINVNGHQNLLALVATLPKKPAVVFTSSRFVYGNVPEGLVNEETVLAPYTPYGLHKLKGELIHEELAKTHNIPVTIFRITNPYGLRSHMRDKISYSVVNKTFIRKALDNEPITLFEGLENRMYDYIFIEDIVSALLLGGLNATTDASRYNLGSGKQYSLNQIAQNIIDVIGGGEIIINPCPKNYQVAIGKKQMNINITKIQKELKWQPKVDLIEGIQRTIEYYHKYRDKYWT
jgi:nucleoside-diphosphate-sugar epimerase